jgi:1,4-alpha-glucan branching enzyme
MRRGELDVYLFHQGTNFRAYEYLGVNLKKRGDIFLYTFRTWAPNADRVSLVSSFHGWNEPLPFSRISENGIWELEYETSRSLEREAYKFRIESKGRAFDKGDPYARFSRGGADGASLIFTSRDYQWGDEQYLKYRQRSICYRDGSYIPSPINIYEMHLGSFMRHDDGGYLSYRELADILPTYIKRMGYTHVEFLPLQEYPFDGSWGYQVCGFYAPSSRFGDPDDLRFLIDSLHKAGIGVIMD